MKDAEKLQGFAGEGAPPPQLVQSQSLKERARYLQHVEEVAALQAAFNAGTVSANPKPADLQNNADADEAAAPMDTGAVGAVRDTMHKHGDAGAVGAVRDAAASQDQVAGVA